MIRVITRVTLLFIVLNSSGLSAIFSKEIILIGNNKPNADIVLLNRNNTQLKNAAIILQSYIQKSTKALLPLKYIKSGNRNTIIVETRYGGESFYNYSKLDEEGFVIKEDGKNIIISGKTDWGTEFGVYHFLESFLRIRWLMPTELWTEIPYKTNLVVRNVNIVENPAFKSRRLFPIEMDQQGALNNWGRQNRLRYRIDFHHNLRNLFKADDVVKNHPNFLPIVNGKLYIPTSNSDYKWQPNFKAKDIDVYASNEIIKYFKQNPNKSSYSLGINDSRNFDDSNLKNKNYSEAYYTWVNKTVSRVNKTYQTKKYGLLAYGGVSTPPTFKLESNVIPFITYDRLLRNDSKLNQRDNGISAKWQEVSNQIGWYDYVYGLEYAVPRIYFRLYQDNLQYAYSKNIQYYVAEFYPNWIEGPKGWLISKLLWNPNQNVDMLLEDWCRSAVGNESAIYIKRFYEIWENFWTVDIQKSKWWNDGKIRTILPFRDLSYLNKIPYDKILESEELLLNAYKKTNNEVYKKRIEDLLSMWKLMKMNYLYHRQKYSNSNRLNRTEIRNINSIKVSKGDIELQINKLDKNPLYSPLTPRLREYWLKNSPL